MNGQLEIMTNTVLYMGEEEKGYKMRIAGLEKKINELVIRMHKDHE